MKTKMIVIIKLTEPHLRGVFVSFFVFLKVDADFLILALSPEYSPEGSVRRQCEVRIVNLLQDYLQELEDKGNTFSILHVCVSVKLNTICTM